MNCALWPPWWLGSQSPFVREFCLLLRVNKLDPFLANNTATGLLETPEASIVERADLFGIPDPERGGVWCRGQ